MTVKELLQKARVLITPRLNWTQRAAARDKAGIPTLPNSPDAVCWCSIGALWKIKNNLSLCALAQEKLYDVNRMGIAQYNDTFSHEQCLERFDKAIALCERE
jgi:hypothetical protein